MKINFKIATPERVVYKEMVDSITLPTQEGEITVLPNHVPLIAILKPGEIKTKIGEQTVSMAVSGGFIEVLSTKVVVLADTAERAEEIDIAKAEAAVKRAMELREKKLVDRREFAAVSAQIEKELVRVKVGRKQSKRADQRAIAH
jgi:F-type H+-transporting ATPase subunit epsilon